MDEPEVLPHRRNDGLEPTLALESDMPEKNVPQSESRKPAGKTDEEIGRAVVAASRALNDALIEACHARLEVEISVNDHAEPGLMRKSVNVRVWRRVVVA